LKVASPKSDSLASWGMRRNSISISRRYVCVPGLCHRARR
jgi:hypothetical protein